MYIETTIPSYLTARPSRDVVLGGHQQITQDWWTAQRANHDLFISQYVLDEVSRGDPAMAAQRLAVLQGIPFLMPNPETETLANELVRSLGLPSHAQTDAYHIAVAALWNGLPAYVELHSHQQSSHAAPYRDGLPQGWIFGPSDRNSGGTHMTSDPIVDEVRAARQKIFAECEYDLARFNARMRTLAEDLQRQGWPVANRAVVKRSATAEEHLPCESFSVREEPPLK